jgi:MFS family permease
VTSPAPHDAAYYRRLTFLFGLAYFAQGLGQAGGLISQPLNYYLKEGLGLQAAQVSEYLAVLTLPWVIKPLYGLVSDFIPLFGYRRRTWLLGVNLAAALGFLWLSGLTEPGTIIVALTVCAFGTASADVIIDALMVESGQQSGLTARYQGIQWMWFKVAAILTALIGGFIASTLPPASALHAAATITMLAPLAVIVASYVFVREQRADISLARFRETVRSLRDALRAPALRVAALFLALWCFSPAFGTPLYFHMTDRLGFDQQLIGRLNAVTALGGVAGAWLFARSLSRRTLSERAVASIVVAAVGILAYHALLVPGAHASYIAAPVNLLMGFTAQIGSLTIFSLAASACPRKAEGFTFAALMSLYNGTEQLSAVIGARLYDGAFEHELGPLLWVAALSLLCCLALVPLLRRVEQHAGALPSRTQA